MRVFILSICLLINFSVFGLNDDFVKGNQQFQAKDYEKAIVFYESNISKNTIVSFENFHNLGSAYYRISNYPKAILNYERALLIQPNNKRLQKNLIITNQKIEDQFATVEPFFLVKWWTSWQNLFTLNIWALLIILTAVISAFSLKKWQLGESRKQRKKGFFIGFSTLVLMLLMIFTAWQKSAALKNPNTAIVISSEIELKTAADENSPTIFVLHSGTKLRLIDELGDWRKVRLPNGDLGWLEEGNFERI